MNRNHRLQISLILTVVFIFSFLASPALAYDVEVPSADFMDLDHPWATDIMTQLIDMGIVKGYAEDVVEDGETYTDYYIKPDQNVTRAEFSTMLAKALNLQTVEGSSEFTDVDSTPWAKGYINALFNKGIIKGYGEGVFRPNAKISRGELVTMITLSLNDRKAVTDPATFTDVKSKQDHWSYDFIPKAVSLGIIKGYKDGSFKPKAMAKRSEVMAMLVNFLNNDLTAGASDEELVAMATDYQKSIETVLKTTPDTNNQESPYDWSPVYRYVTGAEKLSIDSMSEIFNELALYGVKPTLEILDLGQAEVLSKSDRTAVVQMYVKIHIKMGPQDQTVDGTEKINLMKEDGKWLVYSIPESVEPQ